MVEVCITGFALYLIITIPSLIFLEMELFVVYVVNRKKTPEQVLEFLNHIPAGKNILAFYSDGLAYNDYRLLEKLRFSYRHAAGIVIFVPLCLISLGAMVLILTRAQNIYEAAIALIWLLLGIGTSYKGTISFWRQLKTKDSVSS